MYITSSVTVSAKPQTFPLITNMLIGGLIVFNGIRGVRVYKKSFVDLVDTVLYFNLLVFSVFSLYDFKKDIKKQTAVAHISTIITFILFIGAIIYHVILLVKKERPAEDLNEYLLPPVEPAAKTEVTYTVIEPPKRDDEEDPPPADREDSDEQEITEDRRIVTPPNKAKVTHSVVDPPKRDEEDPPSADDEDSDESEITEDRRISYSDKQSLVANSYN